MCSALLTFDLVCALQFFPAWCYALPKTILDLPLSIWEALLWVCIPYFAVGYYKDAGRSVSHLPSLHHQCMYDVLHATSHHASELQGFT